MSVLTILIGTARDKEGIPYYEDELVLGSHKKACNICWQLANSIVWQAVSCYSSVSADCKKVQHSVINDEVAKGVRVQRMMVVYNNMHCH